MLHFFKDESQFISITNILSKINPEGCKDIVYNMCQCNYENGNLVKYLDYQSMEVKI